MERNRQPVVAKAETMEVGHMKGILFGAATVIVLGGCAMDGRMGREAGKSVRATVSGADGIAHGTVTASEAADGLRISYAATGLPPGEHGVHIHMTGKCDGPKFETAGGHWNPTGKMHGSMNPMGPHAGDLPNLEIAADGTGTVAFTVPGATLSGAGEALMDTDGAAFVVHAGQDDLKSDPAGNSGGRVACGVFG